MLGFAPIAGLPIAGSKAASSGTAYSLAGAQGSYAIAGQAAGLKVNRKVAAVQGSYSIGGQTAALKVARKLGAAQGAYALTGQAASLILSAGTHYTLSATQGAYSISGKAATLTATIHTAYTLAGSQGSYALTGQAAAFRRGHQLVADQGRYNITGSDASFLPAPPTPVRTKSAAKGLQPPVGSPQWLYLLLRQMEQFFVWQVTRRPQRFATFVVAELPAPSDWSDCIIVITDTHQLAYSDGTNWYPLTVGSAL